MSDAPRPIIDGRLGTPEDPLYAGGINGRTFGADGFQSVDPSGDPQSWSRPSWGVRNFTGLGSPVVFQSGVWRTSISIPRQPRNCTLDVVLRLEKGEHKVEAVRRAYFSGGPLPEPEPEPPPDEENDMGESTRVYVECNDGILPLEAEGAVIDWLVAGGYLKRPDHYLLPWTSTYTMAEVVAKRNRYQSPEPEPDPTPEPPQGRYVKLLAARVRAADRIDTGVYLVASRDTDADLEFSGVDRSDATLTVRLKAGEPWIRNVYADLAYDGVDLVLVVSDAPVAACAIWQTPKDGPVNYAGFPAMDG